PLSRRLATFPRRKTCFSWSNRMDSTFTIAVLGALTAIGSGICAQRFFSARRSAAACKLAAVESAIDAAAFWVSKSGAIISCNIAAERLLGRPAAELVRTNVSTFFRLSDELAIQEWLQSCI